MDDSICSGWGTTGRMEVSFTNMRENYGEVNGGGLGRSRQVSCGGSNSEMPIRKVK